MSGVTLASKAFSSNDQNLFANLTGDFNPIHLDPIAARITQAGAIIVHGIHAILWALEKLVELGVISGEIVSLTAQFRNFIPVGTTVELKILSRDDNLVRLELCFLKLSAISVTVEFGTRKAITTFGVPDNAPRLSVADQPAKFSSLEELADLSGWMDTLDREDEIRRHFPYTSSALGTHRTAAVALLSRLVGMICPGLHSLFGGFAVDLIDDVRNQDRLGFKVGAIDERFRMVRMAISGGGVEGSVQAFLRWPPIVQAPLREIMTVVSPTEFAGSTALIIGGSRGLGALTAKILAAGGSKVIVTYATGREDAERLKEEITSQTASDVCSVLRYNVREAAAAQLKWLDVGVTHLYYFATGYIARQKEAPFVSTLLDEYVQMYVKGFYNCSCYYEEYGSGAITAFYPSSVLVESYPPGMIEYSMAKLAGEMLCASMNRAGGRVQIVVSRLPRLLTDQTASVFPMETGDPLKAMLPVVRSVQFSRLVAKADAV